MYYFGRGRLINNYKSGSVAIWDISAASNSHQPLNLIKKLHEGFAYKIKRIDEGNILTSGDDGFARLTDVERGQAVSSYLNSGRVWCCHPLSANIFCAGGLMNALYFWDIR